MNDNLPTIYEPKLPAKLKEHLPLVLALLLIGIGLGSAYTVYKEGGETQVAALVESAPSPYAGIILDAEAAVVMDAMSQEVLFAKNENQQLPLASLTKLMTALSASTLSEEDKVVTIRGRAIEESGSTSLKAGERWRLADLIDQTLVSSSNAGAVAIALSLGENIESTSSPRTTFIDYMNTYAKELGLNETYYLNPTGLDEGRSLSGAYGSALDMAKLLSFITSKDPRVLRATQDEYLVSRSENNELHRATNTNILVNEIPFLRGGKTGLTDLAGGNLAVAFDAGLNHPMVAVVLGSTENGRFRDIEKLVKLTLSLKSLMLATSYPAVTGPRQGEGKLQATSSNQ